MWKWIPIFLARTCKMLHIHSQSEWYTTASESRLAVYQTVLTSTNRAQKCFHRSMDSNPTKFRNWELIEFLCEHTPCKIVAWFGCWEPTRPVQQFWRAVWIRYFHSIVTSPKLAKICKNKLWSIHGASSAFVSRPSPLRFIGEIQ